MAKTKQEAKSKRKRIVKPKKDNQVMDGLNMPFEDAMKFLSNPNKQENKKLK